MPSPVDSARPTRTDDSVHHEGRPTGKREEPARLQHPRSFKLRFEASREPGRSYVSLVRPLNLPLTITDKFYSRARDSPAETESAARAMRLVTDKFERGPRQRYAEPVTSSHEYGWWEAGGRGDPRLDHRIRDSPWLKERLRVLAADNKLKHK